MPMEERNRLPELSRCEEMVLSVLWDMDGRITLNELTKEVNIRYAKTWAPQTVSTMIKRTKNKGFIDAYREGRYVYYTILVKRESYRRQVSERVLSILYKGSKDQMLSDIRKAPTGKGDYET